MIAVITSFFIPFTPFPSIISDRKDELNEDLKYDYVNWSGNLAVESRGTFPATITARSYSGKTKADIHISLLIERYEIGEDTDFNVFNSDKIDNLFKKKVKWIPQQTTVSTYRTSGYFTTSNLGRTGLLISRSDATGYISLARIYNADMDIGSWPASKDEVYQEGTYMIIDIYGADLVNV